MAATTRAAHQLASTREQALASRDALSFRLNQMTPSVAVPGHRAKLELDNRQAREAVFAAIDVPLIRVWLSWTVPPVSV